MEQNCNHYWQKRYKLLNYNILHHFSVWDILSGVPKKQRIRDTFAKATASQEDFWNFVFFVIPFVSGTFTAQKKPVKWLADNHLVAGSIVVRNLVKMWRKPSVLSEELLLAQKREEKTYVFIPPFFWQKKWRRERDSNPRYLAVHHISNVAPSTTRPSLRLKQLKHNIAHDRKKSSRVTGKMQ